MQYARYLERREAEAAREVYRRACGTHLSKKPNPHLAWSAFEEKQGSLPPLRNPRPCHPRHPRDHSVIRTKAVSRDLTRAIVPFFFQTLILPLHGDFHAFTDKNHHLPVCHHPPPQTEL